MRTRRGRDLVAVVALVLLAGCDGGSAAAPQTRPDELAAAGGSPCPDVLPSGEDASGHGFGVEAPAESTPSLLVPSAAWVCRYDPADTDRAEDGGTVVEWVLVGAPDSVPAADLDNLVADVNGLTLVDREAMCPSDLGPRWLVALSHDGDLTGVVVEDYGCRHVRLTDDPHQTPPGALAQTGAVGGILAGGQAILDLVGVDRAG